MLNRKKIRRTLELTNDFRKTSRRLRRPSRRRRQGFQDDDDVDDVGTTVCLIDAVSLSFPVRLRFIVSLSPTSKSKMRQKNNHRGWKRCPGWTWEGLRQLKAATLFVVNVKKETSLRSIDLRNRHFQVLSRSFAPIEATCYEQNTSLTITRLVLFFSRVDHTKKWPRLDL